MSFVSEQLRVQRVPGMVDEKNAGSAYNGQGYFQGISCLADVAPSTPEIMNRRDSKTTATMRDGDQGFSLG